MTMAWKAKGEMVARNIQMSDDHALGMANLSLSTEMAQLSIEALDRNTAAVKAAGAQADRYANMLTIFAIMTFLVASIQLAIMGFA